MKSEFFYRISLFFYTFLKAEKRSPKNLQQIGVSCGLRLIQSPKDILYEKLCSKKVTAQYLFRKVWESNFYEL
jgi:hypothetical protein